MSTRSQACPAHGLMMPMPDARGACWYCARDQAATWREWRETAEILGDPDALAEITAGRAEIARGDVVRGIEAVRALRPLRQ